ncbi:hypothetical protein Nepgr_020975 [Nepenthes gracilis]|uniref:Uncharacterized protein n=1 Tax=Nepenthes gracilis TaxID=150966 RepID=A0AAD3SXX4_NEPGR|nr:hypothetical protein Nepgr_020975 [Nepenthes gracilis]
MALFSHESLEVIDIASDRGYKLFLKAHVLSHVNWVRLRIPVEELMDADEVFCTANAVAVASVDSITYQGKRS